MEDFIEWLMNLTNEHESNVKLKEDKANAADFLKQLINVKINQFIEEIGEGGRAYLTFLMDRSDDARRKYGLVTCYIKSHPTQQRKEQEGIMADSRRITTATPTQKDEEFKFKDIEVVREGKQIILPEGMEYPEGIAWLYRKIDEEQKDVNFHEDIVGAHPVDTLVAFNKAIAEIYGWIDLRPTPGFFGSTPPVMISIPTGHNDNVQVPYGSIALPTVDGTVQTVLNMQKGRKPSFVVAGRTKQRSIPKLREICFKTREILKRDSIYKAKAIRVGWEWKRQGEDFDIASNSPRFMDLGNVTEQDLIFSNEVTRQLDIGLWTPIKHWEACKQAQIPLKRGVLLEGPYGTGKSLTALVTAKIAMEHNWTFFYLDSILDIEDGLEMAQYYARSVIFGEDFDSIISEEDRSIRMNNLLNCMDGIDAKNHEVIVVLTTNHVERMHKSFMRPGRIDTVVSVRTPDAEAAGKLVKLYGRDMFSPSTDFLAIGERLKGKTPSVIREIVERSKIATVSRLAGRDVIFGRVNESDVIDAATAIEAHEALLVEEKSLASKFRFDQLVMELDHQ